MADVYLYDEKNIDDYQWPETPDGKRGKDFLSPLIKQGVAPYLQNVQTKLLLAACNDKFLPFTVNEKEYENSYIASNYYALKFYEEILRKKHPIFLKFQKPLLILGSQFLKLFKINQTLFLNNWLLTNSLSMSISSTEMKAIVNFLKEKFPKHTMIYRHVDEVMKKELVASLKESKFHLLKTREIYYYDPITKETRDKDLRRICRRDLKLLEKYQFQIVRGEEIVEQDYPRLLQLYEKVYVEGHTKYSPKYTPQFIQETHEKRTIEYVAIKRNGTIEGFFSFFIFNNTVINGLFGYDSSLEHGHEIYQLLTRLLMEEVEKLNLTVNDGSGGDFHKKIRGLQPIAEYMGLYNHHLPLLRRVIWESIAFVYKKVV